MAEGWSRSEGNTLPRTPYLTNTEESGGPRCAGQEVTRVELGMMPGSLLLLQVTPGRGLSPKPKLAVALERGSGELGGLERRGKRDRWTRRGLLQVPLKKEADAHCVLSPVGALATKAGFGEHGQLGSLRSQLWSSVSE